MRIVLALLALLVAAPPALADSDLATLDHDTTVATFGGRAVWSAFDPVSGRYQLMTWSAATGVQAVPVAQRAKPYDVDLGPSPNGAVMAVYSRAGHLQTLDFTAFEESQLPLSGRDPSLYRNRVAFRRGGALRSAGLDGSKPRVLAPKLRRGFGTFDIAAHRLAYTMRFKEGDRRSVELRLRDLRTGRDRLINRSSSGLLSHVSILGVNFDRGDVLGALKDRRGAEGNRVLTFKTSLMQDRAPANLLDGGFTSARVVYLQAANEFAFSCADADAGPCRLRVTD